MKTHTTDGPSIGRGSYSLPQASRLTGIPLGRLKRWAQGDADHAPVLNREQAQSDFLTFSELMELHFVQLFRQEGVSLQAIRRAAEAACIRFDTHHPFAVRQFDTDGRTIFATLLNEESNQELVEDLARGQLVFRTIIRPFFRKLDYSGLRESGQDEVARYWPLNRTGRVVLDPLRRSGQPIDAQTGIPVEAILDALHAGQGQDERSVADWFGIPVKAVEAARRFERGLSA